MEKEYSMNVLFLLLLANIAIPITYVVRKCIKSKKIKLNHVFCFSMGYLFYWIFPVIVAVWNLGGGTYYDTVRSMFLGISGAGKERYLLCTLAIYTCFIVGGEIKVRIVRPKIKIKMPRIDDRIAYIGIGLILLMVLYLNREDLFSGYGTIHGRTYNGMFGAAMLMAVSFLMLHTVYSTKEGFASAIRCWWAAVCMGFGVLLLSTGARIYVVTSVLALLCLYSVFYNKISVAKAGIALLYVAAVAGIAGNLRQGFRFSLSDIYSNIMYESFYSAYSLFKYLEWYEIKWVAFPFSLLSSFLNLIPTVLFPNKLNYIISYADLGYDIAAPLGAENSFMCLNIEFGLLGTFLVFAWMGRIMDRLQSDGEKGHKVIYALVSANLMFSFFRNGFVSSLIKDILEFSVLVPMALNLFFPKEKTNRRGYLLDKKHNV